VLLGIPGQASDYVANLGEKGPWRWQKLISSWAEGDATGTREKDKRLKKKTVVPVVQAGKVERLDKWLWQRRLG
jgi:hypothetical protein